MKKIKTGLRAGISTNTDLGPMPGSITGRGDSGGPLT